MNKIKDPIILGAVAGVIGNMFKNIGNEISISLGISKVTYSEIAGGVYLKKSETRTPKGKVIGYLADTAIGSVLGIGYVYILKGTGKDHAVMKGMGYSHIAWTVLFGGISKLGFTSFKIPDTKTVLSSYVNHTIYGVTTALAATRLGDPDLFGKEDIEIEEIGRALNKPVPAFYSPYKRKPLLRKNKSAFTPTEDEHILQP